MGGILLNQKNGGSFLEQLCQLYQRSQLPAAFLDASFTVLWASDSILELLPGLQRPAGALDLLEGRDPAAIRQEIASQGHFVSRDPSLLFSGRGVTLCLAGRDSQGPVYLLQPAGETEDSSPRHIRQPQGSDRAMGAFNSRFREALSQIFLALDQLREPPPGGSPDGAPLGQLSRQAYQLLRQVLLITTYSESAYTRPMVQAAPGTALDLFGALRQLCASCGDLLEESGIPLDWEIPKGRFPVLCHRRELEMIFLNLVANSCRFTRPENGLLVRARAWGSCGMVTVSDRGRGIPAHVQPLVFQPYYSYCPARGPFGGLGLGLSCVKGLATALGGTVALTSREGEGTSVTFTLPCAPHRLPLALEATAREYLADRFSPVRVLLCDSIPPPE